jgi:tetratricopeptide (TPR) repeat protein
MITETFFLTEITYRIAAVGEFLRELAAANPHRYRRDLAASLDNLGIWFSKLGRPDEALPAAEEAVAAYQELAAANPGRYRPDLSRSLQALARVLEDLGQTAEADAARREAG